MKKNKYKSLRINIERESKKQFQKEAEEFVSGLASTFQNWSDQV